MTKKEKNIINQIIINLSVGGGFVILIILFSVPAYIVFDFFKPRLGIQRSTWATTAIANVAKECAIKIANNYSDKTFSPPNLAGYSSFTFAGSTTECATSGEIVAKSENNAKYPTFKYNVKTKSRTCFHNGQEERLYQCDARKNGQW